VVDAQTIAIGDYTLSVLEPLRLVDGPAGSGRVRRVGLAGGGIAVGVAICRGAGVPASVATFIDEQETRFGGEPVRDELDLQGHRFRRLTITNALLSPTTGATGRVETHALSIYRDLVTFHMMVPGPPPASLDALRMLVHTVILGMLVRRGSALHGKK
jgi:hypothetical protein